MDAAHATNRTPTAHFVVTEFAQLSGPADALATGAIAVVEFESDRHLHRRGLDFLSGLAFGTRAELEKLGSGVYRLTPAD